MIPLLFVLLLGAALYWLWLVRQMHRPLTADEIEELRESLNHHDCGTVESVTNP